MENNQNDKKKMELIDCMNEMWTCFMEAVIVKDSLNGKVERFLEAKNRAHKIVSQMD